LKEVTPQQIAEAFQRNDLKIFTDATSFHQFIKGQDYKNATLLLMSSGNYGGLDLNEVQHLMV
jgi:UDP-N-acetylmuramate: L-alanyl-gamma-D-glutamyl-meso-diaminopimelate ligase